MARAKVKAADVNSGRGDNLRVAESCDTCIFAGFKAAYHGGKRITGLCLRYKSAPEINYHYSAFYFSSILHYEHGRMRSAESLEEFTFEKFLESLPSTVNVISVLVISYFLQKGRKQEIEQARSPTDPSWRYRYTDAKRIEMLWVDNLPDDLTENDWPYIVAEYLRRGGYLVGAESRHGSNPLLGTSGQTREEILAPLRQEWENLKTYHMAWRDYFANSPVTKIKRTTICDNYTKLEGKRPRVNTSKLL